MALCTVTQNLCYVLHMEAEIMMKFLTLYIPSHRTLRQVGLEDFKKEMQQILHPV